jgi:hypothetical protein
MYEWVTPLGHPDLEERVARVIASALPPHHHPQAVLDRIEPLETFHERARSADVRVERETLERHATYRARAALLLAVANGNGNGNGGTLPPVAIPATDIAILLLTPRAGVNGLGPLLDKMRFAIQQDQVELASVETDLASPRDPSDQYVRPRVIRQAQLEDRIPIRLKALKGFLAAFPQFVAAAVGDADRVEALVAGLGESRALGGQLPAAPSTAPIAAALADVEAQLGQLGAVRSGPIAAGLRARRDTLRSQLDALHVAHMQAIETAIKDEVARALAGDIPSWGAVIMSIYAHPGGFIPGLAGKLSRAAIEALAANDPCLFASCLEANGREF